MIHRAHVLVRDSSVTRIGACALVLVVACIGPEPKPIDPEDGSVRSDAAVGDAGDAGASGSGGAGGTGGSNMSDCGDGSTQANEECDDGNRIDTDACRNSCLDARCGDGAIQIGVEVCDDGNRVATDRCTNSCQSARCGDGVVQKGAEQCDDGNRNNTDACSNSCMRVVGP